MRNSAICYTGICGIGKVMAHCVYTAFEQHLKYFHEPVSWATWDMYKYCKEFTHASIYEYTFAGVIPWMYMRMLQVHNTRSVNKITMRIQLHYVPWECLLAEAGKSSKWLVMNSTPYHGEQVDKISLSPAVYCMLNQQHALFATSPPQGKGDRIIMAIRLRKYEFGKERENGQGRKGRGVTSEI
jgi:hypothetical protein